jgi:GNAT superfamily N-acetyltransferase
MAVDPEMRRQAVATELLAAAEQVAARWGYDR